MDILAFDLETAPVDVETWDRKEPIGITCGALYGELTTQDGPAVVRKIYWAGMQGDPNDLVSPEQVIDLCENGFVPPLKMSADEVYAMLMSLACGELFDQLSMDRIYLFTHNGSTFDFPAIAAEIPERKEQVVKLMEDSIDPCFQIVRTFGWPISLDNIAKPMLGEGKPEGMDGSKASLIWPVEAARVLRYCMRDAKLTHDVARAIMAERQVRWIKRDGSMGARPFTAWKTVKQASKLPEPNRKWMSDYQGQWDLENLLAWTK